MNNAGTSTAVLNAAKSLDARRGVKIAVEALISCNFSPADFPDAPPTTVLGLQRMQRAGLFGGRTFSAATPAPQPPAVTKLERLPSPSLNLEGSPEREPRLESIL